MGRDVWRGKLWGMDLDGLMARLLRFLEDEPGIDDAYREATHIVVHAGRRCYEIDVHPE